MKVRTRFAPSPTGLLHLGGIRTALFAWLFAKQHKGVFMLRIEDTDKSRENAEGIENITESLKWLGLDWDEGPDGDKDRGEFGPYIQSKRLDIYLEQAKMLMEQRKAYADPYTKEELDSFRQQAQMQNKPFLFRNHRPKDFVEWKEGMPIRLKTPLKRYEWQDIARGKLSAGEEALDDYVLIKADGYPTYNFAHIVDDHLMQITHVIRGEEFISSMPKFLATYDVLGWQTPEFVTMPPVLNQEGGKKLSKRHGAQPVLEYRQQGYLKEAIINFMASLGWNDGTDQEIYTLDELISKFRLERLQKTGAHFNPEKLNWMNGEYIRGLDEDSLMEHAKDFWPKEAEGFEDEYKLKVLGLVKDRLKYFAELEELTSFFFKAPKAEPGDKVDSETLKEYISLLEEHDFSKDSLEKDSRDFADKKGIKTKHLFMYLRIAVTGSKISPGLFETFEVLGQKETINRLKAVS